AAAPRVHAPRRHASISPRRPTPDVPVIGTSAPSASHLSRAGAALVAPAAIEVGTMPGGLIDSGATTGVAAAAGARVENGSGGGGGGALSSAIQLATSTPA